MIEGTDQSQWYAVLDARGDDLALERKWDILEWLLVTTRVDESELGRASGLSLVGLPDVREVMAGPGDFPRDLLTRIRFRQERSERTNTADVARVINQERNDTFGECASAFSANWLELDPPDFQWRVTDMGLDVLYPPAEENA
jgi:hypothetical protein